VDRFFLIACKVSCFRIVGNAFNHILIWKGLETLGANGEFELRVLRHMYAFECRELGSTICAATSLVSFSTSMGMYVILKFVINQECSHSAISSPYNVLCDALVNMIN
jgi:hypothetical protein